MLVKNIPLPSYDLPCGLIHRPTSFKNKLLKLRSEKNNTTYYIYNYFHD